MTKRPTIKGRGAEIFLGKEDSTPEKKYTVIPVDQYTDKATFYLPSDLLNRLDTLWMNLRKSNRKLRKSHLVKDLIEKGLKQHEGNV